MTSLLFLLLCYFVKAVDDFWEENLDFYLETGTNLTCLPLTEAYQSICVGTSCQLILKQFHHIGYTQVVYTFNLYFSEATTFKFWENGQKMHEVYSQYDLSTFSYCNLNQDVKYFKITSNLSQNANPLFFSITSDKPSSFIITNFKIYVLRCHKYCLACNNSIFGINDCTQCKPSFSVSSSQRCQCPYQTPYIHQDQCINKCPNGFYPQNKYCVPCNKAENILFDDQANKFTLIKDFNTTNRLTSFTDNGKLFAGLFIQNEAITYSLPQPISMVSDLQLNFEIYVLNLEKKILFSLKFDDYIYHQYLMDPRFTSSTAFVNSVKSCSVFGISNCQLFLFNLFIPSIDRLQQITLYSNIPLHNLKTSWALGSIQLDRIEQKPKAPCFQKQFYEKCVQDCPPTTQQVGSICQNITTQYPFAQIVQESLTKSSKTQDLQLQQLQQINLCSNMIDCVFQFYSNQYIFGGHRIWNTQQHALELDCKGQIHYKAKIYMKILLIDPLNDLDTLTINIEDKHYVISQSHINSTCINNLGSGSCLKQEDIGTSSTDYIIQIEIEVLHRTKTITLDLKCNANSKNFYCAFYDFIVLVVKCPLHCSQCTSSTDCILEENSLALQNIIYDSCPEQYYYYNGDCIACEKYCKQCNSEKCLACHDQYEMIGESCICKYNRVNAEDSHCYDQCFYSCSICLDSTIFCREKIAEFQTTCLACNIEENKVMSGVECVCLDGYYMDTSNIVYQCKQCNLTCKTCDEGQNCLTCNSEQNREIYDNRCICQQGYYEIEKDNLICQSCSFVCKTCINSVDICTSCYVDQNRILSNYNTCNCQLGYFEDENQVCQKCNNNCETCLNNNTCISCDFNIFRKLNNKNQCECKENYYQNENNECLSCFYTCRKCNNNDNPNNCTECPQTRMRNSNVLDTFECICKKGYYDFGHLECLSCSDFINPPQDHYCYSKCGDQIIQWNEECDDGNLNSRDECDQCYFPISSCTNNLTCINCQQNKCLECIEGYYLNKENICEQCADQCLTCSDIKYNCNQCKYKNDQNKNCISCSLSEGYQSIDDKCYSICGDEIKTQEEECDDGNLLNNDGCNQYCLVEEGYTCHSSCAATSQIKIILQESDSDQVYESKREIFIFFNCLVRIEDDQQLKDLISIEPVQEDLKIQNFQIIDNTDYSSDFNEIKISILFEIVESYRQPQISVLIQNSTLIYNSQLEKLIQLKQLITVIDFSKEKGLALELIQNATPYINYFFQILIGLVSSSLLLGGFDNFMNLFETLQFISYLKYINISYPESVQQYFQLFNFAEFNFIRQFITQIGVLNQKNIQQAPVKFYKEGYSTIFLSNLMPVIIIFVFMLGFYISIKTLMYYVKLIISTNLKIHKLSNTITNKNSLISEKIIQQLYKFLFLIIYSFPLTTIRAYILCNYNINVSIFLQIQSIEISNYYLTVNSILSLICLAIQFYILYIGKPVLRNKVRKQRASQYNISSQLCKVFKESFISFIHRQFIFQRKIMLIGFLVLLYAFPYYQLINILALNLIQCAFLIKQQQIKKKSKRIKSILIEAIFIITLLLILLVDVNKKYSLINFSFINQAEIIIIIMLSFVVIIEFIFSLIQYFQFILKKYHIIIKFRQIYQQIFTELTENDECLASEVFDSKLLKFNNKTEKNVEQVPSEIEGRRMVSFSLQQSIY